MEGMTITEWGDEMVSATYGEDRGPSLSIERLLEDVARLKALRFPVRIWCIDSPQYVREIRQMIRGDRTPQDLPTMMEMPVLECHKAQAYSEFVPPVGWRTGVWVEFSDDTFEPVKGTLPPDVEAAFREEFPSGIMPWQGGPYGPTK